MAKSKRDAASPDTGNLDRQAILDFVRQNPEQANKRAIAKRFGIKGGARVWLKTLLKQLERDGLIEASAPKSRWNRQSLPGVLPLEILAPDQDGDVACLPIERDFRGAPPRIYLAEGTLETARKDLEGRGAKVFTKSVDVSDGEALKAFVAEAGNALGGLDILVANASGGGGMGESAWQANFDIDVMGAARSVEAATPFLVQSDAGSIVFISKVSPTWPSYVSAGSIPIVAMRTLCSFEAALWQTRK